MDRLTKAVIMALVSISEAARLAGTVRSNLYKSYIEPGILSVTKDAKGKPKIDTSELLRVFGELKVGDKQGDNETVGEQIGGHEKGQQAIIEMLKQQLEEAREREQSAAERERFYQQQIRELTNTMKLLEHRPQDTRRPWWSFWKP